MMMMMIPRRRRGTKKNASRRRRRRRKRTTTTHQTPHPADDEPVGNPRRDRADANETRQRRSRIRSSRSSHNVLCVSVCVSVCVCVKTTTYYSTTVLYVILMQSALKTGLLGLGKNDTLNQKTLQRERRWAFGFHYFQNFFASFLRRLL